MNNIDLVIILTTAFLGSIGHCIGMCGGIVVAYSSSKINQNSPWSRQVLSHLAYNFGRITTYAVLGAIFGFIGKVIAFTPTTKGVLFVLTGTLMILAGASLLGNFTLLSSAEYSISKQGWFKKMFQKLIKDSSLFSFYTLGMLNGIIPCGLVYSFAIFAASTANPLWGAIVMATFGLATIPALFFLGAITKFLQHGNLRGTMMKLAAMLVIFYGILTLYKGYKFIVYPKETQKMIDQMQSGSIKSKLEGKCGGGMKCEPGKCG
ncbi:MAG: sulfite exporter TauE/SafE family protein [Sulfurovum sp.]|nr:sulfite exporter TauE/SafE family protein [Sulfurovum sp.]MCB4745622.1 sulfite exporter TauE/SafE family protein [Sulfurovum sp.]MCB4748277.1 sulfite exporter TauE/SafE family protein [Sulfurovum sp.]MCB4748477.1 sulfite exporter TauE/SafE family protein [Sulfurovum sp.]MCB4750540.1 sulfite exporter TauE/SafE family protein [Sulfurovum sp.]